MNPDMLEKLINNNIKACLELAAEHPDMSICLLQYTDLNFPRDFYHMELSEYQSVIKNVSDALLNEERQVCLVDFDPVRYNEWLKENKLTDDQRTRSAFAASLGRGPEIF